jgi:hypothetical protein
VGSEIRRLAVPAVLIPAPNMNTSVGMISSPPATPSRLLIRPMNRPNRVAKARRRRSQDPSGRKPETS